MKHLSLNIRFAQMHHNIIRINKDNISENTKKNNPKKNVMTPKANINLCPPQIKN
jgi:hypothetical protein